MTNAQYDKVVYAAPAQTATIPHQAAASGEQYAVSTKAVNKTSEKQQQQHVDAPNTTKDLQGVSANSYVVLYVTVFVLYICASAWDQVIDILRLNLVIKNLCIFLIALVF